MNKKQVFILINDLNLKEVKFFSRMWSDKHIVFKSSNKINYIVIDFEKKEWAQR